MAPGSSRSLLVWTIPTLALLLTLWLYRKKKESQESDPGGTRKNNQARSEKVQNISNHCNSVSVKDSENCEEPNICALEQIDEVTEPASPSSESELLNSSFEDTESITPHAEDKSNHFELHVSKYHVNEEQSIKLTCELVNCVAKTDEADLHPTLCAILNNSDKIIKVDPISEVEKSSQSISVSVTEDNSIPSYNLDHTSSSLVNNFSDSIRSLPDCDVSVSEHEFSETSKLSSSCASSSEEFCPETEVTLESEREDTSAVDISGVSNLQVCASEPSVNPNIESDITSLSENRCSSTKNFEQEIESGTKSGESCRVLSSTIENLVTDCSSADISETASSSTVLTVMARKTSTDISTSNESTGNVCDEKKLNEDNAELDQKLSSMRLGEASSEEAPPAAAASHSEPDAVEDGNRCERDSANHSPAEAMLTSPVMSNYSDAHSEGSSDSGKGCSEVATPPSRTPASGGSVSGDVPILSVYEFVLPQIFVGRLIGKHGCFVTQIKSKTNANILIKKHPDTPKLKICAIEGTQIDIDNALEMIREKFPEERYPQITLEQVSFVPPVPTVPIVPEFHQLYLVEGITNDVILSCVVSPAQFFVQQPTHPTFPSLNSLCECMNICYNETDAPPLPSPISVGVICAACTTDGWFRVQIVSIDEGGDTCVIKFVDYGGYLTVQVSTLRQIRGDFMTLPFQAAECYLANVCPAGGFEAEWSKSSMEYLEELSRGQVLQAQICGYAEDGLPLVYLYLVQGSQVIFVNQDLVHRGLAEWYEPVAAM